MKLFALALAIALPGLAAAPTIDKDKAIGTAGAPVLIETFSDYQCPMCKTFYETTLPRLNKEYAATGKAYIVPREFPLHPNSRLASNYVTAAARVGKYHQVSSALYRAQQSLGESEKVWEVVASVLTPAEQKKVQALAKEPSIAQQVQGDVLHGQRSGITGTPTLIISRGAKRHAVTGYLLQDRNYNLLKAVIDGLLK
jgi:protein-disulfide isomerase